MFKKGQAAMEFLMTYGWAILVVLVAIGALAYFGVLNPSRFLPSSCTITPGIGCDDFKVTNGATFDTVQVVMRNGMGTDFSLVTVVTDGCGSLGFASWADGSQLTYNSALNVSPNCIDFGPAGSRFKGPINVTYSTPSGTFHKVFGAITTRIE